jgi:hypothetical protein
MTLTNQKPTVKLLLASVFILCLGFNLFSIGWMNSIGLAYCSNCEKDGPAVASASVPIETYVIEGAGYFFNGFADTLKFSNRFEMAELKGVDFKEMGTILDSAISNMEQAKEAYLGLVRKAEATPYNQDFIGKLMGFNYTRFGREHSFNYVIFKEVRWFLKKGDVTGLARNVQNNLSEIVEKLRGLKADIDANRLPGVNQLWELNELFGKNLLAGQYGAAVFASI